MKLLIIRHGDPDYSIDSLTEKGWREAEYLSQKMRMLPVHSIYVSPLGRARDTASVTLEKLGMTAEVCEWLTEFNHFINRPDVTDRRMIPWDWLPKDWMQDERFFHYDQWHLNERMQEGRIKEAYDYVTGEFDRLLAKHGYVREGHCYRAERPNNDTIVFFCHFGLECVLNSYLLNTSPMILWHGSCAAPSSVTTFVTEERREGIANFRMTSFGDTSHLYVHGEESSVAARFCETFANQWERHD